MANLCLRLRHGRSQSRCDSRRMGDVPSVAEVARKLGQSCVAIMMFPTDAEGSAGALTTSAAHHAGETVEERIEGLNCDARVNLAGPIANVRYSGRAKRLYDGTDDDFKRAQNAALSISLLMAGRSLPQPNTSMRIEVDATVVEQANSILSDIMAETESLVSENWPVIERVARERSWTLT